MHLTHDVLILRVLLHRSWLTLHMHHTYTAIRMLSNDRARFRSAHTRHIIDHVSALCKGGAHDLGFTRIDGNSGATVFDCVQDRHNPSQLDF